MAARDFCLQKELFLFKAFSKFWLSHPFLQIYLLRKMNLQLWTLTFFFQNQSSFKKWMSPPELINWIKVLFFPQVQVVIAANTAQRRNYCPLPRMSGPSQEDSCHAAGSEGATEGWNLAILPNAGVLKLKWVYGPLGYLLACKFPGPSPRDYEEAGLG